MAEHFLNIFKRNMKKHGVICQKCLMPVQTLGSVCESCKGYFTSNKEINKKEKKDELEHLISSVKSKTSKYDLMVTLTGGKDSTFVLYYLTSILKKRVLAFTWDNGLIREKAWKNINNAISHTKVDHYVHRWDKNIMRDVHRSMFKTYGTICFCTAYWPIAAIPIAIENKVPLIFTGFSEGQRMGGGEGFYVPSFEDQKNSISKFYRSFKEIICFVLKRCEVEKHKEIANYLTNHLSYYLNSNIYCYPIVVSLSSFVDWGTITNLTQTLHDKLGWEQPVDHITRTSCKIEAIKGFVESQKGQGVSGPLVEASHLVRKGAISREEAAEDMLKLCVDGSKPEKEVIDDFCNFLSITEKEFFSCIKESLNNGYRLPVEFMESLVWLIGIYKKEDREKKIKVMNQTG